MKLSEEKQKRLEEIKSQISMEREYSNKNIQYYVINEKNKNNKGFINIIFVSLITIIIAILIIIFKK